MESPYQGRATIHDNITNLQIIIPAKRNWFIIIFIGAWLCMWLAGEVFALAMIGGSVLGHSPAGFFIVFWVVAWTAGGFMAFRFFLWSVAGKEIVTIGQGTMMIEKKGALLAKPKTYDLKEVKNIRVQEDIPDYMGPFGGFPRSGFGKLYSGGTIRFDYGLQTVKFAGGIDEAEAKYILGRVKEKHFAGELMLC